MRRHRDAGKQTHLFERAIPAVAKQEVWNRVVRHERVAESVAVVIRKGDAHALADVLRNFGLAGHILEGAVAPVSVERVRKPLVLTGMTIDAQVPRAIPAELVALGGPVHVVHHEQIQPAIVVVVEPARGDRPGVVRHARFGGDVLEPAVAHVAEQMVALHARNKQVDTAIIVEIAGGRPGRIALRLDPRPLGHIGERQAAVVVKEAIPVTGVSLRSDGMEAPLVK